MFPYTCIINQLGPKTYPYIKPERLSVEPSWVHKISLRNQNALLQEQGGSQTSEWVTKVFPNNVPMEPERQYTRPEKNNRSWQSYILSSFQIAATAVSFTGLSNSDLFDPRLL